ncbi:MAG: hypothetical protein EOM04_09365 [Clostridia bacterium]|nr:hypothetical protein [Clostridia bacterium]
MNLEAIQVLNQDAELSAVAYKLLLVMYCSPIKTNLVNDYLLQFMKEGRIAVGKAKKELEEKGYIQIIRLRDKKTKNFVSPCVYCVLDPEDFNIKEVQKIIQKLDHEGFEVVYKN